MMMQSLRQRIKGLERQQVAHRPVHSIQFDKDALTIYHTTPYLHGTVYRNEKIEPTGIYARGRELHTKRYGPIVPAYLDSHLKRSTLASTEFEFLFDREPGIDDVLRFEHMATLHARQANSFYFDEFIGAWHRQMSPLECPLKFEEGALFKRVPPIHGMEDARWVEDFSIEPEERWLAIEYEMNRMLGVSSLDLNEGMALVFLGRSAADEKHQCRPATKEELRAPETEEFKQLCNSGLTYEQMSAKHWRLKTHEILITVFGQ